MWFAKVKAGERFKQTLCRNLQVSSTAVVVRLKMYGAIPGKFFPKLA
jgi:hypothetical protein